MTGVINSQHQVETLIDTRPIAEVYTKANTAQGDRVLTSVTENVPKIYTFFTSVLPIKTHSRI